jgi:hypothetical protein
VLDAMTAIAAVTFTRTAAPHPRRAVGVLRRL